MKVLLINKFWYPHGGADVHAIQLATLLQQKGVEVGFFGMEHPDNIVIDEKFTKFFVSQRHNNKAAFETKGKLFAKIGEAARTIYARDAARNLELLLQEFKPDVAHLHNIYHHLSPSIVRILKKYNIPTVQTLHDYKRICPNHALFVNNEICRKCKTGGFKEAIKNKCIFDARLPSTVVATEMYIQKIFGWYDSFDAYIAPSEFMKREMVSWGKDENNITVIPNWVLPKKQTPTKGKDVAFVGGLSKQKGVEVVLSCARALPHTTFHIMGGGAEKEQISAEIAMTNLTNVIVHGVKTNEEMDEIYKTCCVTLVPSKLLDNFPNAVLESFARGIPVIGSRMGGIPEMIEEGHAGFVCNTFETHEYVTAIKKTQADATRVMGENARLVAQNIYNPEKIIPRIMALYQQTIHLKGV